MKKGDRNQISMLDLHHNKKEWIEPEKFIPERFDPQSKYYLTPQGKKRHPMSFAPFLGGKRICLGKTFAEMTSKIVGPKLIYNFDFTFVNPEHDINKPSNNIDNMHEPEIFVRVQESKISQ